MKIVDELKKIDTKKRIREIELALKTETNPRVIDSLVRELKILKNLDAEGLHPAEAFTRRLLPVMPSIYRSPIELPDGNIFNPDINILIRNVGIANKLVEDAKEKHMPEDIIKRYKINLYKAVEDLAGFESPKIDTKLQKNPFSEISGSPKAAKTGFFQKYLTKKRQNLTGRAVISPRPELDIDEAEIPYDIGFKVYEPFLKKELLSMGYTKDEIENHINKKSDIAKSVLRRIGKERPVVLNRAPSIWQGSVTGHKPIFTDKKAIGIPSLLTAFQKADFDGDSCLEYIFIIRPTIIDKILTVLRSIFGIKKIKRKEM